MHELIIHRLLHIHLVREISLRFTLELSHELVVVAKHQPSVDPKPHPETSSLTSFPFIQEQYQYSLFFLLFFFQDPSNQPEILRGNCERHLDRLSVRDGLRNEKQLLINVSLDMITGKSATVCKLFSDQSETTSMFTAYSQAYIPANSSHSHPLYRN